MNETNAPVFGCGQQAPTLPAPEFAVHLLNDQGIALAKEMAGRFTDLLNWLQLPEICVQSRELSLAKTKLEEAAFFAKKAMATNLVNQKVN